MVLIERKVFVISPTILHTSPTSPQRPLLEGLTMTWSVKSANLELSLFLPAALSVKRSCFMALSLLSVDSTPSIHYQQLPGAPGIFSA